MRSKYRFVIGLTIAAAHLLAPGAATALAGLLSSISYNQFVLASPFDALGTQQEFTGTTLPVSKTLSVTDGGSVQATYNFTDNGTVATINISGSFNLPGQGQMAEESTDNLARTRFEFSQPVFYQFVFQGTSAPNISGGGFFNLYAASGQMVLSSPAISNNTWQSSGTLPPNVGFSFEEQYEIFNGPPGPVYLGSGTDSLSLTFTAIPEPSSFCLLAAVGTGLLSRRRQP